MANTLVEFVGFDGAVLAKDTWQATSLHCPRCGLGGVNKLTGQAQPFVWVCQSEAAPNLGPGLQVNGKPLRLFLCISCAFAGRGWDGAKTDFNVQERAKQIIQQAFGD